MRTLNARTSLARSATPNAAAREPGILPTAPQPLPAAMPEGRVQRALQIVESGKTFNIRDLARELHLSPSYFQRLFKHHTGLRIGELLCERRLQKAAQLLAGSYMSVKEVAHAVGYEHSSSFIRAFERRFSQPPSLYRRQSDHTKC